MNSLLLFAALLSAKPVFIGDSITHNGSYLSQVQLYQALREPGEIAHCKNSGCAGDSGLNIIWRWDEIAKTEATEYFVMLGMNDFGLNDYTTDGAPDEKERKKRVKLLDDFDGFNRTIYPRLKALGKPVTLMTPSPYDSYSTMSGSAPIISKNGIGLAGVAEHERKSAAEYGFRLIELHRNLSGFLKNNKDAIRYSADRVHPSGAGALLVAAEILEQLGYADSPAEELRIQAKNGTVNIVHEPKALPYPRTKDWEKLVSVRPKTAALNRFPLIVSGLAAGKRYTVSADGRPLADFTAEELAEGINLAELDTPSMRQAQEAAKLMPSITGIDNILRKLTMVKHYYAGKEYGSKDGDEWAKAVLAMKDANVYKTELAKNWQANAADWKQLEERRKQKFNEFRIAVQPNDWRLTVSPAKTTP